MKYFTLTMWNGKENFALWDEKPPKVADNRKIEYLVSQEVPDNASLEHCIEVYKASKN